MTAGEKNQWEAAISKVISVVDSHTAGEPTRLITGGLLPVTGTNPRQKQDALFARWPGVVQAVVGEPRGTAPLHAVLPVSPDDPSADVGLLIFSALGPLDMCGHALIGAVTCLLETGTLPIAGPVTRLRVETIAGLIDVEARSDGGKVTSVTFRNAPAWVLAHDVKLDVPGVGKVTLDLVYGGLWYALVDAPSIGLDIDIAHINHLMAVSGRIRHHLNSRLPELVEPAPDGPSHIPQLLFTSDDDERGGTNLATSTELGFDRSPCGTGSSARMALLRARGALAVGDTFTHRGVVGTAFTGRVAEEVTVGRRSAIIPEITGSAWITAFSQLIYDDSDPLAAGIFVPPVDAEPPASSEYSARD